MAKTQTSKTAKFLKTGMAVLLIMGASIGATLFYYAPQLGLGDANAKDNTQVSGAPVVLAAPIFTALDPFTVTLRGERSARILYIAITLRVKDENSRKLLLEYMPEVRDRVLQKLSEQNPDHVQTPAGRADLVHSLTQTLAAPYLPQPEGPGISSVLFTAFVVQ